MVHMHAMCVHIHIGSCMFYACIYIYLYTYIHIYLYTYIHIYTHIHIYMYTYIHVYIYTYIHRHVGVCFGCMQVCLCTYVIDNLLCRCLHLFGPCDNRCRFFNISTEFIGDSATWWSCLGKPIQKVAVNAARGVT